MIESTAAVDAAITRDRSDLDQKTDLFESLLHQNPAISLALGAVDLIHKMRELFVDIAILEGEERGIFVGERTNPSLQTDEEATFLDELYGGEKMASNELRLQLQSDELRMPELPSGSVEDLPTFELDDMDEAYDLSIPGQFSSPVESPTGSSKRLQETAFANIDHPVNPYAALALSSVLATLFVVGIVIGRHYYLTSRLAGLDGNVEDELERGEAVNRGRFEGEKSTTTRALSGPDGGSPSELNEKTALESDSQCIPASSCILEQFAVSSTAEPTVEFDEKAAMELGSSASPIAGNTSPEQAEAGEAMAVLIDVANAAFASTAAATVGSNMARTPRAVSAALEMIRSEVANVPAPQTRHLHDMAPTSRPGTPLTPVRSTSTLKPTVVVSPVKHCPVSVGEGVDIGNDDVVENEVTMPRPASQQSNASFVSAYSHMPGGVQSIGRAAGRNLQHTASPSTLVTQCALSVPQPSRAVSPTPSFLGAFSASPALSTVSYSTAIEAPPTPAQHVHETGHPNDTSHSPSTLLTSPGYHPQHSGILGLFNGHTGEGDASDGNESMPMAPGAFGAVQTRPTMLPPAQLTQTALELALMLPATEWVFQFLVVFIGWFGFWMGPVNRQGGEHSRH